MLGVAVLCGSLSAKEKPKGFWGEGEGQTIESGKDTQWYSDAKFAMFIHWGLYSGPGGIWEGEHYYGISEWLMNRAKISVADYEKLATNFNPTEYDANEIAKLAADAGMKYIVITSKHHDGFGMYDSKVSDYDIVDATPFKRDILKELEVACKAHGLKLGIYYSQAQDWHERHAFGNEWEFSAEGRDYDIYMEAKALPQVEELLENYEIQLIFFDTPVGIKKEQVLRFREAVERIRPNCLVNSRIGQGLGDYATLGDNEIPDAIKDGLWEAIDTHNNSWAYSKLDINWKSSDEILHNLVRVLCKGGNFMFNIGPKGDGSIPKESVSILREVGKWVHANEEAIYGTRAVAMGDQKWIEGTHADGKTFLFVLDWPKTGKLWIPKTGGDVKKAYILEGKQSVKLARDGDRTYVELGKRVTLNPKGSVIVLEHEEPLSFDDRKWVVPGITNELFPHSAKIDGVEFEAKVRWMEIFGDWQSVPSLQYWEEGGDGAAWDFYSPEAGNYYLEIEYSAAADGDLKEGVLTIDGEEQPFVTVFTGDTFDEDVEGRNMPRYMKRRIGMIALGAGDHVLSLRRNYEGKTGWIRLSKVSLTPAN